jgi:hypothetical protein
MENQSEVLERKVASARVRRQDKQNPLLISMTDFLLFPNVPNLRKNQDMILFRGNKDASLEERKRYVESMKTGRAGMRAVVDSGPFDVAKASSQDLVDFAMIEYGEELNIKTPRASLVKQVVALAKKHEALVESKSTPVEEDIS